MSDNDLPRRYNIIMSDTAEGMARNVDNTQKPEQWNARKVAQHPVSRS